MSQSTIALQLGNVTIRQTNGLFCLNDLHKAAGGTEKLEPNRFLRLDQTTELIKEIQKDGATAMTARPKVGTYACRELVIAYAAWISAAFHLKVIRVFLDAVAPQQERIAYSVQPGQTLSEPQAQALRAVLEGNARRLPQDKRGSFIMQGWSKLKAHFKTDYRHIPAPEFDEALSLLLRHVTAQLPEAPAAAPAQAAPTLRNRRWLIATDFDGSETVLPITPETFFSDFERLPRSIDNGDLDCTDAQLIDLVSACMRLMQRRQQRAARTALVAMC